MLQRYEHNAKIANYNTKQLILCHNIIFLLYLKYRKKTIDMSNLLPLFCIFIIFAPKKFTL